MLKSGRPQGARLVLSYYSTVYGLYSQGHLTVQDGCLTSSQPIKIPAITKEGVKKMVQRKHGSRLFRKIPLIE